MNGLFSIQKFKQTLLFSSIVLLAVTAVTLFFGITLKVAPPYLIIKAFVKQGYVLHHNYTQPPLAFGLNLNVYIYFIFFVGVIITMLCRHYISRNLDLTPQQSMFFIGCILFLLVSLNQLNNFLYYYNFERKLFSGRTLEERNANLYDGLAYRFSLFCHQYISGSQNAKLISDVDFDREPGMLTHRMMAYYLYPIDIRNVRQKEPDYLLFFLKKNAQEYVPDNFQIIAEINKKYLIAKRK